MFIEIMSLNVYLIKKGYKLSSSQMLVASVKLTRIFIISMFKKLKFPGIYTHHTRRHVHTNKDNNTKSTQKHARDHNRTYTFTCKNRPHTLPITLTYRHIHTQELVKQTHTFVHEYTYIQTSAR